MKYTQKYTLFGILAYRHTYVLVGGGEMREEKVDRTYVVIRELDQKLGIEAIKKETDKSKLLNKILQEYFKQK